MGDPSTDFSDRDPVPRAAPAPVFSCPRCGSLVPVGATRCQACADHAAQGVPADLRGAKPASAASGGPFEGLGAAQPGSGMGPPAAEKPSGVDGRKILAGGCLTVTFALVACTIVAAILGQKLREAQVKMARRQQQQQIDEERQRYESEQARNGVAVRVAEPSGELAILAKPLVDLSGHEVSASTTLEHGGVIIAYPMGCPDCVTKFASVEKCFQLAHDHGLGAQLLVVGGTADGVAKDKIPESLRGATLLDADGKVGEALNVRHLTAIVVDSDGSSIVYRGTPEEAKGMIPSVKEGD